MNGKPQEVVILSDDDEEPSPKRLRTEHDLVATASAHISAGAPINVNLLLGQWNGSSTRQKPMTSLLKQINNTHGNFMGKQNGVSVTSVIPNARIPRHIASKVAHREPEERLKTYNIEATSMADIQAADNKAMDIVKAKFKCTYRGCNRVIDGNIPFICHLWAHIVEIVPSESLDQRHSGSRRNFADIRAITTCQQCLASFQSPQKLQVHYTRCHSRLEAATNNVACRICEKEVPVLLEHLSKHPKNVAPYACQIKTCFYRTTERLSLFSHYVQVHANTMYLWCPFCNEVTHISRSQLRTKDIITCPSFVNHIMEHQKVGTSYRCDSCAYSFLTGKDVRLHKEQEHTTFPISWTVKLRPISAFQQRISGRLKPSPINKSCVTCVLNGKKGAKCAKCRLLVYEENLSHSSIKTLNDEREGWPSSRDGRYMNICECGFQTRNGEKMALHRLKICNLLGLTDIFTDTNCNRKNKKISQEDRNEASIFGVIHPADPITPLIRNKNDLEKLTKIKDELADIDEAEFLVYKQFLTRSRINDVSRSLRTFDLAFKSKIK